MRRFLAAAAAVLALTIACSPSQHPTSPTESAPDHGTAAGADAPAIADAKGTIPQVIKVGIIEVEYGARGGPVHTITVAARRPEEAAQIVSGYVGAPVTVLGVKELGHVWVLAAYMLDPECLACPR